ncbi:hypothetical protein [Baekduia sp. Peel2402]|uniref:hypothetical protein n=1 Tax=Baekduia sp. Peel2402 TaxID=3458296 RepID=UPI00403EC583
MRRALFLTVAIALATSGSSAHAATWSAPQSVSQPHTFAGPLLVSPRSDGRIVAAWPWQDNIGNDAIGGEAIASRPAGSTAFEPEAPALDGVAAISAYARDQTLSLAAQGLPTRDRSGYFVSRLRVSFDNGTARTLATAPVYHAPVLATAQTSTRALIAYIQPTKTSTGANRRIVRVIDRRNGAWTQPSTIAGTGRADQLAAAANARGDQVVAFARQGQVLARVRHAGHGWGSLRTLATSTTASQTTFTLSAAVDARGQVRVVWRRHVYRGATSLQTAAMLVGRSTFTTPQTLITDGASATFTIVQAPGGWAIATVETTAAGPRPTLHRTSGGSAFGPTAYAAPTQGGLRNATVAAGFDGTIAVAWIVPLPNQNGGGIARGAAIAPNTTAFGPVEDVSPAESVSSVRLAPTNNGITALWVGRPTTPTQTVIRAATRTP